ncbi:polysaccharide pyruvyl transferase family protein [Marinifilum sp. RC60d5]|uniref:polysaccharide pyruvyl transferase family protein n=1 Tax=Marinifilum sp. RC60d5 TaxID=3458414 RepID=UPI0040373626
MKIGILTYHRAHNYGAVLQCYALKKYLSKLGYNPIVIDYYYPEHLKVYDHFSLPLFFKKGLKDKIKYVLYAIIKFRSKRKRINLFNSFIEKHINPVSDFKNFDLVIYGSDQIWRKQPFLGDNYGPIYFGSTEISSHKKVAFSASMGVISKKQDDMIKVKNYLQNFDEISVREESLKDHLDNIFSKPILHTLDPVFLLSQKEWEECLNLTPVITYPYILYYNLHNSPILNNHVKKLVKENNFKVIEIRGEINSLRSSIFNTIDPIQFLSLIKHANYVVSSSFHGTALSIIFQKAFWTYAGHNNERILSLLKVYDLESRFISDNNKIDESKINYSLVDKKLEIQQNVMFSYLDKNLRV